MFTKLMRLGADAELKTTPSGTSVAELSLVYDVGRGDNKQPQWVRASLWGKRAEATCQYLTKGTQIVAYLDEILVDTYTKRDGGHGATLKGRLVDFEFAGSGQQQSPQNSPAPQASQQPAAGADDFDDQDIPF